MNAFKNIAFAWSQKTLEEKFYSLMRKADKELAKGIEEDKKCNYHNAVVRYTRGIQIMEELWTMLKEEEPKKNIEAVMNEYILRRRELADFLKCMNDQMEEPLFEEGSKEHKDAVKYFAKFIN
jgi:hypothetical protein